MWVWETDVNNPRGVIVMVHGAGEHHGRYEWLRKKFLNHGFHVVAGDLPGQGENPRIRGHIDSFDEMIDAVYKWINKAKAFACPILIFGHSLGGLTVIRTLQEKHFKPQAVLLSSPCLGLYFPPPRFLVSILKPLNIWAPSFKVTVKRSTGNSLATQNQEILKRDATDPFIVRKVSIRWYFELEKAIGMAIKKANDLPDVPLFIFQAGSDKIVDKQSVQRWFDSLKIRHKQFKEWPGLYHEIFNEPEREQVFQYALKVLEPYF